MSTVGHIPLKFGPITLNYRQRTELTQTWALDGGHSYPVAHSGKLLHQSHYDKQIVNVTASGCWRPSPFAAWDRSAAYELSCMQAIAKSIAAPANTIALPPGRRTDALCMPWAEAELPDGDMVATAVTIDENTATLDTVSGAVQYHLYYYPKFTAYIIEATTSIQDAAGTWSWAVTFREA